MARSDWQLCQIQYLARQGVRGQPVAISAGLCGAECCPSLSILPLAGLWDPPARPHASLGGAASSLSQQLSHTGTPTFHTASFTSAAPLPSHRARLGEIQGRNFFTPSPIPNKHKTPLSFFRASPALATPAALPALLSPRYAGQSFCTTSKPSLQICLCPQCSSPCSLQLPNTSTSRATISRDIWMMAHE